MDEHLIAALVAECNSLQEDYNKLFHKGDSSAAMDLYHDVLAPKRRELAMMHKTLASQTALTYKEEATDQDKELFHLALTVFDTVSKPNTSHWGKVELGAFINVLTTEYSIIAKDK